MVITSLHQFNSATAITIADNSSVSIGGSDFDVEESDEKRYKFYITDLPFHGWQLEKPDTYVEISTDCVLVTDMLMPKSEAKKYCPNSLIMRPVIKIDVNESDIITRVLVTVSQTKLDGCGNAYYKRQNTQIDVNVSL